VITTSGVVPWGNRIGSRLTATRIGKNTTSPSSKNWSQEVGSGSRRLHVAYMNRILTMEFRWMRACLEAEGVIGQKLYPAYYVIPGNQGSPAVMRGSARDCG
jgi:hypothetical protein